MATEQRESSGSRESQINRRRFLQYAIGAVGAFMTLAAGIPVIGSFVSPALRGRSKKGNWTNLGSVEAFTPGEPRLIQFSLSQQDGWVASRFPKAVWVVREEDKESFVCYNSRCTHLGCAVDWKEGHKGEAFYSPCHGGVFTIEGEVIAGPPPRPLDRLDYKIEDGKLLVNYLDFQLGVPEKKAI